MSQIHFGTDGWRAVMAQDFTFANVARVAQATAVYWKSEIRNPRSEIHGRPPKSWWAMTAVSYLTVSGA